MKAEMTNPAIEQMILEKLATCQRWGKSYLAIPRFLRGLPQGTWKRTRKRIRRLQQDGILLTKVKKSEPCISLNPRRAGEIFQRLKGSEKAAHRIQQRLR